jgi:SAM-dependent methyltransferase
MTDATFDAYAEVYADVVNAAVAPVGKTVDFFARMKVRRLLRIAGRINHSIDQIRALDVGCGTGLTDSFLLPQLGSLDGVDVSPEMVRQAESLNLTASYQVYDGERLPFPDRAFDLVFAACVLHHVPPVHWDRFVAELWRVTARPGAAVVIEHNPLNPLTRRSVRACPFDEDAVLASPRRVQRAFRNLGVSRLERQFMTFLPIEGHAVDRVEDAIWWLPAGAQYTVTAFR